MRDLDYVRRQTSKKQNKQYNISTLIVYNKLQKESNYNKYTCIILRNPFIDGWKQNDKARELTDYSSCSAFQKLRLIFVEQGFESSAYTTKTSIDLHLK